MNNIKVLILDDDDELRYNLSLFLEDEGFDCYQASDCSEALMMLKKMTFDVAVVDIRLPGMSGDEFIPIAKTFDSNLKYIVHTGSTDFTLGKELVECGLTSNEVFRKPVVDMTNFSKKINELVK